MDQTKCYNRLIETSAKMSVTYHWKAPRHSGDHFELFWDLYSAAAALREDFARVVGLRTLLGFKAFRILNTVHAVPIACPAAPIPSCVALPASSPYLHNTKGTTVSAYNFSS